MTSLDGQEQYGFQGDSSQKLPISSQTMSFAQGLTWNPGEENLANSTFPVIVCGANDKPLRWQSAVYA